MGRHASAPSSTATAPVGRRQGMLVEILVVVTILGVLAAVTLTGLAKMRAEAERVACVSSFSASGTALEVYRARYARYPDTIQTLRDTGYLVGHDTEAWTVAYTPTQDGEHYALTATTSGGESCGSTSV